jgi:hypothetical protein
MKGKASNLPTEFDIKPLVASAAYHGGSNANNNDSDDNDDRW